MRLYNVVGQLAAADAGVSSESSVVSDNNVVNPKPETSPTGSHCCLGVQLSFHPETKTSFHILFLQYHLIAIRNHHDWLGSIVLPRTMRQFESPCLLQWRMFHGGLNDASNATKTWLDVFPCAEIGHGCHFSCQKQSKSF